MEKTSHFVVISTQLETVEPVHNFNLVHKKQTNMSNKLS